MKGKFQHQGKKVQDLTANSKHLLSILINFDVKCVLEKDYIEYLFYDKLKPLIKL